MAHRPGLGEWREAPGIGAAGRVHGAGGQGGCAVGHGILGWLQTGWMLRGATEVIGSMEHLSYEDRLRDLGGFQPEEQKAPGDLMTDFQYLKGHLGNMETDFSAGFVAIGQGVMALNRKRVDLDWI